jgi:hypothetical protein
MEVLHCHYTLHKNFRRNAVVLQLAESSYCPRCNFHTAPIISCDRHRADSVYNSRPPFTKVDITWHANPQERQPRESNRRQWKHRSQSKSKPDCSSSPATRSKSSSLESVVSPRWPLISISSWATNQRLPDAPQYKAWLAVASRLAHAFINGSNFVLTYQFAAIYCPSLVSNRSYAYHLEVSQSVPRPVFHK